MYILCILYNKYLGQNVRGISCCFKISKIPKGGYLYWFFFYKFVICRPTGF